MLTNLAYAGAGDNTYEDVIPTGDGITGLHGPDNDGIRTYTEAKYYIPPDANPTTIPQTPSVNSDGGVSESTRQFGYLYNWCAAMGNQQNTGACLEANKPTLSRFVSICPKNWRIPADTGAVNQFANLNNAVNSARWYTDTGLIDSPWLGQRGGYWNNGFSYQGDYGYYWAPFQDSGMFTAKYLSFGASHVYPINYSINKSFGLAVRCLLK